MLNMIKTIRLRTQNRLGMWAGWTCMWGSSQPPPHMDSVRFRHQARSGKRCKWSRSKCQTPADDLSGQEDGSELCFVKVPLLKMGKPRDRSQLLCFHSSQQFFKQTTVCKHRKCKGKEGMTCVLQKHTSQQRRNLHKLNSRRFP